MAIQINGTSGISGVDGSAGTPALQGTDSNTGISFGTDTVNINTGGTTRATVDSSGRLGVGTASPSTKLELAGDAATQLSIDANTGSGLRGIVFKNSGTAICQITHNASSGEFNIKAGSSGNGSNFITFGTDQGTERARIDSSGRLLVGTSSASGNNLLQVNSDISANGITVGKGASSISTNTALGISALGSVTSGYETVACGHTAGSSLTTGIRNVFVGYKAGSHDSGTLTTGSQCVFIGAYARPSAVGSQREHVFGYDIVGKGNSTTFIDNGCYQGNNSSSWSTTSDRRLKKNIVDNTEGLDVINQVRVVNFEYRLPEEIEQEELQSQALVKRDENDDITGLTGVKLGVIAQELQQVCPDCVKEESSGILGVVDDNLFWHLINAVKELSAQNASLEARLTTLEGGTN